MYGQALRHAAEFFIEFFAIDLIMDDEGRCRGVVAIKLEDGSIRFSAQVTILATGGTTGAPISPAPRRIPAPATATPWCCAPGCRCRTWRFVQFHPTGVYGAGVLITEGARGGGLIWSTPRASASCGALRAIRQGPGVT